MSNKEKNPVHTADKLSEEKINDMLKLMEHLEYTTGTIKILQDQKVVNFVLEPKNHRLTISELLYEDLKVKDFLSIKDLMIKRYKELMEMGSWGIKKITFCEQVNGTDYMITFERG